MRINRAIAELLRVDAAALSNPEGVAVLAGNTVPENAATIAQAYAGHQFGGFVPSLGDGRAILLGEVIGQDGVRYDVQLKGSGRTPFSRNGDGRAGLGPVLREYIVSEGMAALGVPSTRALAAVTTGEIVEREYPLPGAVLTRVAQSHIRVGTFQYFAARGDIEAIRQLADYAIERHDADLAPLPAPARYNAMLERIIERQASLIARWLSLGFIHGVMNTDNMAISGETIDYGPCAFMDTFHPGKVFSSIDRGGRYAWGNQPRIGQWNLSRLAETLLPLFSDDETLAQKIAQAAIDRYAGLFSVALTREMRAKLGLASEEADDLALAQELLSALAEGEADFTLFFHHLADLAADPGAQVPNGLLVRTEAFDRWRASWHARLDRDALDPSVRAAAMRRVNPAIIPRNHRVEEALEAANTGDYAPFEALLEAVTHPFEPPEALRPYMAPPRPEQVVRQTFCGT